MEDVTGLISAVGAVLAAVFAGFSWWSSRQSKDAKNEARTQAERASTAADRAATAQEQTADASTRVAEVMERGVADAEAKPWRIDEKSDGWHLVNTTTATKYGVTISGEPVRSGEIQRREIDGQESMWLDVFIAAQTQDRTITVRWYSSQEKRTGRLVGFMPSGPTKSQRLELN